MPKVLAKQKSPTQVFIRKVGLGDAVSILLVVDEKAVEFAMPPAQAMQIAGSILCEARVAQFGELSDVDSAELDAAPKVERLLDVAIFSVSEALKEFTPVPVANSAAGTA